MTPSLVALLISVALDPASATTVFSQPLNNSAGFGLNSNGPDSNDWSGQQIADDFSLTPGTTISSVSWFGSYYVDAVPAAAKSFVIRLWSESSGVPASILFAQVVSVLGSDTSLDNTGGRSIMSYTAALAEAPALSAGTPYFLSILEDDASTTDPWTWSYADVNVGSTVAARLGDVAAWVTVSPHNMAFSLAAVPIPEPTTAALLCMSLAGLATAGRGHRNSSVSHGR